MNILVVISSLGSRPLLTCMNMTLNPKNQFSLSLYSLYTGPTLSFPVPRKVSGTQGGICFCRIPVLRTATYLLPLWEIAVYMRYKVNLCSWRILLGQEVALMIKPWRINLLTHICDVPHSSPVPYMWRWILHFQFHIARSMWATHILNAVNSKVIEQKHRSVSCLQNQFCWNAGK